jgi:hypothetical protein
MGYTIDAVLGGPREFLAYRTDVEMAAYDVSLHDLSGNVYNGVRLVQRRDVPTPYVGQRVAGNLDQGRHGLVLRHAYNPDSLKGAA